MNDAVIGFCQITFLDTLGISSDMLAVLFTSILLIGAVLALFTYENARHHFVSKYALLFVIAILLWLLTYETCGGMY